MEDLKYVEYCVTGSISSESEHRVYNIQTNDIGFMIYWGFSKKRIKFANFYLGAGGDFRIRERQFSRDGFGISGKSSDRMDTVLQLIPRLDIGWRFRFIN